MRSRLLYPIVLQPRFFRPLVSPFRSFSVLYKLKSEEENYDTIRKREEMYERALKDREFNSVNSDIHTYKYFRELNRLGEHMAVKRLYEKYHNDSSKLKSVKVDEQYIYAIENLKALKRTAFLAARKEIPTKRGYRFTIMDETFNILTWAVIFYLVLIFITSLDLKMPDEAMKFEIKMAEDIKTRLDDVKGIDEIKDEIQNLIKMIKYPHKYKSKGAKLHKGVLLFGDPGVGKTLLARAIAGESGVSFIYCTGSSFDEVFVGVGAKRVRQLFQAAREHSP